MQAYCNAAVERITLDPRQGGLGEIGHIGYFRPRAISFWQETLDWFFERAKINQETHMPPLSLTAMTAAILGLIFFRLSLNVIGYRRQHKVSLGNGGHDDLERAMRAQGNFAEYVPISLILIACLELNAAPWWLVAATGVALIVGRLLHAKGIKEPPPNFALRVLGMKFTLFNLIALSALNLGWVGLRFLG